jgi:hypothetical protein
MTTQSSSRTKQQIKKMWAIKGLIILLLTQKVQRYVYVNLDTSVVVYRENKVEPKFIYNKKQLKIWKCYLIDPLQLARISSLLNIVTANKKKCF